MLAIFFSITNYSNTTFDYNTFVCGKMAFYNPIVEWHSSFSAVNLGLCAVAL